MTITRRTALKGALVASASLAVPGIVRAAPRRVIVIGAGAAGMTAADRLLRRGIQVQVYEAGAQKGGRIRR
ncbi:MAG: NAD(P)-binding protein, partial [Paracoccaceae bacterium]